MYRILLSVFLLVAVCACRHAPDAQLARAEFLLQSDPDRALSILDSISESAGYDDSINMKLHFLRGHINAQKEQYREAMREALTAEYLLSKLPYDAFWNGRVQLLLGIIYDRQKLYTKSVGRFRSASEHYRISSRPDLEKYALLYMAETYAYAYQPDSAIVYLTQILNQADSTEVFLHHNARQALIYAHIAENDYVTALSEAKDLEDNGNLDLLRAEIFTYLGQADSARYYLDRSKPSSNDYALTHYLRAKIDSIEGDFRSAYLEMNKALELNNEVALAKESAWAESIEEDFLREQMQDARELAARKRITLFAVIGVLIVVCVTLYYIMYKRRLAHRVAIEQSMAEMVTLINEVDDAIISQRGLSNELERSQLLLRKLEGRLAEQIQSSTLPELFRESFRSLDAISTQYFAMQDSPAQARQSIKEFERELTRLRGKEASAQILRTANECYAHILADLAQEVPSLTEADVLLFAYQLLGFSPKSISLLLQLSLANFYKKRTRLKARIEKSNFSRKGEFLALL